MEGGKKKMALRKLSPCWSWESTWRWAKMDMGMGAM